MAQYCIVVSEITRREIYVVAENECEALILAKKRYDEGEIILSVEDKLAPVFHPKY